MGLSHVKLIVAAVLFAVSVGGVYLGREKQRERVRQSIDSAATVNAVRVRDSIMVAAALEVERLAGVMQEQQRQADSAKAAFARSIQRAETILRANAATERLEASIRALNDSVKHEASVRALVVAAEGVKAENAELRRAIVAVRDSGKRAVVALEGRLASDAATVSGLGRQITGLRNQWAAEAARPKRTPKAMAGAAAVGAVLGAVAVVSLQRGNE